MGKAGTGAPTFSTGCQSLSSPICFNLRRIILASGLSYIKYRIRRMVPKRHVVSADMGCPFHGEIRRRNLRASRSLWSGMLYCLRLVGNLSAGRGKFSIDAFSNRSNPSCVPAASVKCFRGGGPE